MEQRVEMVQKIWWKLCVDMEGKIERNETGECGVGLIVAVVVESIERDGGV